MVDELLRTSPMGITLDTLSNALKSRGFRRTPGSPRLITRLRNLKGIEVTRAGIVRLMEGSAPAPAAHREPGPPRAAAERAGAPARRGPARRACPRSSRPNFDRPPAPAAVSVEGRGDTDADTQPDEDESPGPGNEAEPGEQGEPGQPAAGERCGAGVVAAVAAGVGVAAGARGAGRWVGPGGRARAPERERLGEGKERLEAIVDDTRSKRPIISVPCKLHSRGNAHWAKSL